MLTKFFSVHKAACIAAIAVLAMSLPEVGELKAQSGKEVQVPLDWRVRTTDGRDVSVSDYAGKPIFLNLWASWCAPCKAEMASIAALKDSLAVSGNDDTVFLLISPETRKRVSKYANMSRTKLPLVVELDPLPAVLGIKAVPTTWIVDRNGKLLLTHRGAAEWNSEKAVTLVRSLLN